ncbi:hypothetical protein SDC9_151201 [bioreactor metagenome]|uniref:Uncharacterized protein n=1 Tax=bioreactor metagenome TaxID=1076179 RepID=A0A645ER92_9ZZZZ
MRRAPSSLEELQGAEVLQEGFHTVLFERNCVGFLVLRLHDSLPVFRVADSYRSLFRGRQRSPAVFLSIGDGARSTSFPVFQQHLPESLNIRPPGGSIVPEFEESGRDHGEIAAFAGKDPPVSRIGVVGKLQVVFCPGDAHEEEPFFLLFPVRGARKGSHGYQPRVDPDNEDAGEFQPLAGMKGQKPNRIPVSLIPLQGEKLRSVQG